MRYNDFCIKVVLYDLRGHTHLIKKLRLHNVDLLKGFLKDLAENISQKNDLM